nr:ribonuclease H-like domain, reverse transcriptase, RNA-dependent DNA polymerase [Tanacetum cinerariifolium]
MQVTLHYEAMVMQVTLHDKRIVMKVALHYEAMVMQVTLHDKRIVMQVTLHYEAIVMQVTLHDKRIVMQVALHYEAIVMQVTLHDEFKLKFSHKKWFIYNNEIITFIGIYRQSWWCQIYLGASRPMSRLSSRLRSYFCLFVRKAVSDEYVLSESVISVPAVATSEAKTSETKPNPSKSVSKDISNEVRESHDAPLVKELVFDDKLEKKTIFPTVAKIEFVRPKQQEKPIRKPVKNLMEDMLPLGEDPKEEKLLVKELLKLNASNDEPQPYSDAGKKDDEGVNKESGIDDQEKEKTHREKKKEMCNEFKKMMHKKFQMSSIGELTFFLGLDYAGASLDRKFTTGGCQFLGSRLISWQCKKRTVVANSTTKAEYCLDRLMIEMGWKYSMDEIGVYTGSKSTVWNEFGTNIASAAICLAKNQKFNFSKLIFDAVFNDEYDTPSHTKKVFANMRKQGKDFSRRVTLIFETIMIQNYAKVGEGLRKPAEPQHIPTTASPSHIVPIHIFASSSQPKKTQKHKKTKRKAIETSQSSRPTTLVADETVHEERRDRVERAATTASSLEAEQDNGNILKTQSMETLNEPIPQGTGSGSGLRCQDTILKDRPAQTRFERLSKQSHEPPLSRVNILGSMEDIMKLMELMELCTKLSDRLLALENNKTAQDLEIIHLKKRVKRPTVPPQQNLDPKDKGKGKMVKPQKPLKKKDQIKFDMEVSQRLQAQFKEEERMARQQEEDANIVEWDDVQAMMEADHELAKRLKTKEQGELTIKEKSKLFVELMNQRKKHFTRLRVEEKRRKLPTKSQKRN